MPRRILLLAAVLVMGLLAFVPAAAQAADEAVDGGWFYSQTGPGDGTGFAVTNADGVPFWSEFQRGGGVAQFGYPVSRRWTEGFFTLQAFQKSVFQWQPGRGLFFVNIYDKLSSAGLDDQLLAQRLIPLPQAFPQDLGQPFSVVMDNHLALLDQNQAIETAWYSNPRWLSAYGLPVAYHDFGDLRVLRAQRTVFQQWMIETSFARPGQVVLSNGGDHYKDAGQIPAPAVQPHAVDDAAPTVTPAPAAPAPTPAPPAPTPAATPAATPAPAPAAPASAAIGRVTTMAASPTVAQDQIVFLGTSTGGVLRSTNRGASFTQIISGLPNPTINAVLPSPGFAGDGLVLAATNNGIARSTDGGQTWAATASPAGRIGGLTVSPRYENDRAFYAMSDQYGLHRSSDGGATWTALPGILHGRPLLGQAFLGMAAAEGRGPAIFVFTWSKANVYVTADRGESFRELIGNKKLPSGYQVTAAAFDPEWRHTPELWVGTDDHGLYRSLNGGSSYERVLENPDDELGRITLIALSPLVTRDGTIMAGTRNRGVFLSKKSVRLGTVKDIGAPGSWEHRSVNLKIQDVRGLVFSNNYREDATILAAGETQLAFSTSGAIDWFTYPQNVGPTS